MDVAKILKGQMFFISAIFVILGFVMLAGLLTLPEITEEKIFQESSYADRNLNNIRNEYDYLAGLVTLQARPASSGGYMNNFSRFVDNNLDAEILYVFIFSNGSTMNFTADVGNFLDDSIDGNISFSTGGSAVFSLAAGSHNTYNFSGTDDVVSVILNYTVQNTNVVERFAFNDSSRNYAVAFFDLTVREREFLVRSKSLYNRTW